MTHGSQESGTQHSPGVTWDRTTVSQEADPEEGTVNESLYCGFHGEEGARQGEQAQDWLL